MKQFKHIYCVCLTCSCLKRKLGRRAESIDYRAMNNGDEPFKDNVTCPPAPTSFIYLFIYFIIVTCICFTYTINTTNIKKYPALYWAYKSL